MKRVYVLLAVLAISALAFSGCGGGGGDNGGGVVSITISPTSPYLTSGQTQNFTAAVTGTSNSGVLWKITEGSSGGSISVTGTHTATYTAPQAWNTYHVVATSAADITKTATAVVEVGPPLPG